MESLDTSLVSEDERGKPRDRLLLALDSFWRALALSMAAIEA